MPTDQLRDEQLAACFNVLRDGLAAQHTPSRVEDELMQAFARQHAKRRWHQRWNRAVWAVAGGLAAAVAAATFVMLPLQAPPAGTGPATLTGFGQDGAFIALEPLERIRRDPDPRIVETEIARTALASLGVPVTPENAGDQVRAEMLVGADGRPLALRLSTLQ